MEIAEGPLVRPLNAVDMVENCTKTVLSLSNEPSASSMFLSGMQIFLENLLEKMIMTFLHQRTFMIPTTWDKRQGEDIA